jgi:hypothetical protein
MTYCALGEPTVAHYGELFQVETPIHTRRCSWRIIWTGRCGSPNRGQPLCYHVIIARQVRVKPPTPPAVPQRPVKPKPTHPWHRRILSDRHTTVATPMKANRSSLLGEKTDIAKLNYIRTMRKMVADSSARHDYEHAHTRTGRLDRWKRPTV